MAKISVIIPVYNTEKYLKRCLDSVINQTLKDIEIICINDASTDGSLNILKDYAAKDNRIKIIDLSQNVGAGKARNIGIENANGEYIGFIDSDDFIDLDFYEKLYSKAVSDNYDVVKGNIYDYDDNTSNAVLTDFYNQNGKIKQNKINFLYGFTSAIYNRNFIHSHNIHFPNNLSYFEDPYFSIQVAILSEHIGIADDAEYFYVRHFGSATKQIFSKKKTVDFLQSVDEIMKYINNAKIEKSDYIIVTSFLLNQLLPYCYSTKLNKELNCFVIKTLTQILVNSDYDTYDLLEGYFMKKREESFSDNKKNLSQIAAKLRTKILTDRN